jgi:hypothetical protein
MGYSQVTGLEVIRLAVPDRTCARAAAPIPLPEPDKGRKGVQAQAGPMCSGFKTCAKGAVTWRQRTSCRVSSRVFGLAGDSVHGQSPC